MVRPVDPARPEPVAEQAAAAAVATVVRERIAAEEELHAAPEVRLRRAEDEMRVRGHDAVGEALPAVLTHYRAKPVEQLEAVRVVDDDARVACRLRDDVVESPGGLVAVEACHDQQCCHSCIQCARRLFGTVAATGAWRRRRVQSTRRRSD